MTESTSTPPAEPGLAAGLAEAGPVAQLSDEAVALVARLPGPLRRVRLQLGEAEIEVEWAPDPALLPRLSVADAASAVAPGAAAAGAGGLDAAAAAGAAWLVPPAGQPGAGTGAAAGVTPGGADPVPGAAGTGAPAAGPVPGAVVVEAPVVGLFYRAPSPDADPFVEIGERVEPGRQLAIIEAMKLMNPIEAEVAGVVVAVHAISGNGVEYGQPLFEILPDQP